MLEAVFYMFLAGCSDDMTLCQEIASPAATYATAENCMFDLAAAVQNARSGWPVTHGVCRRSAGDRISARPGWLPMPAAPDTLAVAGVTSKSAR